jgi:hypothetical protein
MAILFTRDRTQAKRLQRGAMEGTLRRLYSRLYTDDLVSPVETLVRRELYSILAAVAPSAVISHRSALASNPIADNEVFLTGPYRHAIELPGLTLRIARGHGALASDIRIPTVTGTTHRASDARALLENLKASTTHHEARRRTMGKAAVEQWLDRLLSREGERGLNRIRDRARQVADELDLKRQFERLDGIIGALLGTRRVRLTHPQAVARMQGMPYDERRLDLFRVVAEHLQANPPRILPAQAPVDQALQAFIESYFSNYIEGTEFELDEAHQLVMEDRPVQYREDDSHDVIGTFNAILESVAKPRVPADFDAFLLQLKVWNRQVIFSRAAKRPGQIKDAPNRAGDTLFVAPELVVGTLMKGFELIRAASTPQARAALAMFVTAEVHPFADGNGRTARLAMNLILSESGLTRIIVPTAFREDYTLALKALSHNSNCEPYGRMLQRAADFSRWLDYRSQVKCFEQLRASNALKQPHEAKLTFTFDPNAVHIEPSAPITS